jgi:hypothetical protein
MKIIIYFYFLKIIFNFNTSKRFKKIKKINFNQYFFKKSQNTILIAKTNKLFLPTSWVFSSKPLGQNPALWHGMFENIIEIVFFKNLKLFIYFCLKLIIFYVDIFI